jgi:site-specific recombinase XerD
MKTASPNTLGRALRRFFSDYLPRVRGASSHTIQSYRDAFVLLLRFVAAQRGAPVSALDLSHLGPQEVLDFLQHLEVERHSVPATRNVRLAAIHAFFRYCAAEHPDHLELCQRVLAIPFKRARSRPVEYLEFDEIQAVLTAIDRTTASGRRDYALLATMFNTGARVHEIITVRGLDVRLQTPPHVRLFGKGRKEVFAHCGHKQRKYFARCWPKGATARYLKIRSSVTIAAPASPGSASDTFSENTAHEPKRQDPRWRVSAFTRTACAIALRYTCYAPASTSSQSAIGLGTPVSP